MKVNSIRTKVLAALLVCLILGVGGTLLLLHYSFAQTSQTLAEDSVRSSRKLFSILSTRDISKMSAVSDALITNPQIRDAFAAKDRARLLEVTAPLHATFKAEGITNWLFHTSEPTMTVFLRLHNPTKFGDPLNRFIDTEVARTHKLVSGNELAKAGFAVRIIRPVYDSKNQVTGYLELGEEIGRFIREMKAQTGDDYALLLNKQVLDRQFWADSSATLKRRDNWDDNASVVVADQTTTTSSIIKFQGDLAAVPEQGSVLERYNDGDSVFVRGIFPIQDASKKNVGAMFVVRDISSVYQSLHHTKNLLLFVIIVALAVGAFLILTLLTRLVFRRLDHIIAVATRVVGGDYESEIRINSNDEIGQFELLFEQFRCVFVDLLKNIPDLQEKR